MGSRYGFLYLLFSHLRILRILCEDVLKSVEIVPVCMIPLCVYHWKRKENGLSRGLPKI